MWTTWVLMARKMQYTFISVLCKLGSEFSFVLIIFTLEDNLCRRAVWFMLVLGLLSRCYSDRLTYRVDRASSKCWFSSFYFLLALFARYLARRCFLFGYRSAVVEEDLKSLGSSWIEVISS